MQVESVQRLQVGVAGTMELLNPWDQLEQRQFFKGFEWGKLMPLRGEPGH